MLWQPPQRTRPCRESWGWPSRAFPTLALRTRIAALVAKSILTAGLGLRRHNGSTLMSAEKLTILISPTHRCNMRCDYCYVSDTRHGDMSLSDFEAAYTWIVKYCQNLGVQFVDFTWFGGEPLLYGKDKLESALRKQNQIFSKTDIKFVNRMQSNLTLVNNDVCRLISEYFGGFIGGSFEPYGKSRKYKDGCISVDDVERKIELLHNAGIRIGIVSTLVKNDLLPAQELFAWYKHRVEAFRVNRAHSPDGNSLEKYLTVKEYNDYVIALCDLYTHDNSEDLQFTNFTAIARSILLNRPFACTDILEPYWKLSIAGNGEIASYCRKKDAVIGNYYTSTVQDVIVTYKQYAYPRLTPKACRECESYANKICSGSCWGEPDKDCAESNCGYRSEYTKETISYVQRYLQSNGITRIEDCYATGMSKIL